MKKKNTLRERYENGKYHETSYMLHVHGARTGGSLKYYNIIIVCNNIALIAEGVLSARVNHFKNRSHNYNCNEIVTPFFANEAEKKEA